MSATPARSAVPGDLASVLDGILRRHGMDVLETPRRLFALLRDYAPESPRDVRVLMTALESGAPDRLRADPATEAALAAETDRMVDLFGCSPALARAALDTWNRCLSGYRTAPVQPLPSPSAPAIRPLPLPHAGPGVPPQMQPLSAGAPQPVRPLPLPLPLPLSLPLSAEPAPKGWFARRAPIIGAVLLLIAATARLLGSF